MTVPYSDHRTDLRISPKVAIALLALLGVLLTLLAQFEKDSGRWASLSNLALLSDLVAALAWVTDTWKRPLGRWVTIAVLIVITGCAHLWLGIPGLLALLAVPTALAVAMVGPLASTLVIGGETVLLVAWLGNAHAYADRAPIVVALLVIWAVYGTTVALYMTMKTLSEQMEHYLQQALSATEEMRNRRAAYAQAVDDLAHANRQLALLNDRANRLRLIAEEAQQVKDRFVARVSHEFRTPLNMIIGLVEIMVEHPETYHVALSPSMYDDLKVVHRNCEYLSKLVDDVLDLGRLETDHVALRWERVSIKDIIDGATEAIQPLLEAKRLALCVSIPPDLPTVYCDSTRIAQVVLNLLSNAARYTEQGSIAVEVSRRESRVVVGVSDTGPGISAEDVERIFEPFFQAARSGSGKGGSGLGLCISKRFVELHGGQLRVQSRLGVGSTFTFDLPVSPPLTHIRRPGSQISEEWIWHERQTWPRLSESHYRPRLLVCDQVGDLHLVLKGQEDEAELDWVNDLAQAAEALRESPASAVLLNVAEARQLEPLLEQAKAEALDTPIVACCVPPLTDRATALGAVGHLVKPVRRADLDKALREAGRPVRRVLIVDDDPEVLHLLSSMLRVCDGNLEIVTAGNGAEALDRLQRSRPDLMLLDIVMPDMDGWQVLEAVAQSDGGTVPTYMVSAQGPADQAPRSEFLLVATGKGIPLSRLVRCTLQIPEMLVNPEATPGSEPAKTPAGVQAWTDSTPRPATTPGPHL